MTGAVGVTRGQVCLQADGLTVHLEMKQFAPLLWVQVRDWFSGNGEQAWLRAPFEGMTAEGSTADHPRWKQVGVDGLSWLIFVLMVPADHPLVRLWQAVDWATINQVGQDCYSNSQRGQRAWAPAQLFALLVLLVVVPVCSETALIRTVAITPLYRWVCGFGVLSKLPDHSSLYTFRQRLGAERFEAILTWVVGHCLKRGLISNELLFFDMMGVSASAHGWSPYERAVLLNCRTDAYKQAQAHRFGSEGLFGLARRLHGADKMPYRSLAMNHIAGVLLGIVMNLAVLARRGQTITTE